MLQFSKLSKHPNKFKRFTGLTLDEFIHLRNKAYPVWRNLEQKRLKRKNRIRETGGGRKSNLPTFDDELFLILIHYRLYLTVEVLGYLIGLDDSNVCRHLVRLESLFAKMRLSFLARPKGIKKINSLNELFEKYPDLVELTIDGTEQAIQRPKKNAKQRKHYSGKKKQHTIKTQIIITKDKRIFDISGSHPGSFHDYTIFKKYKTPDKIPKRSKIRVDKGYQGIEKDYPEIEVYLPKKATRGHKLTKKEKKENKNLAKKRIYVEHVIGSLKRFKILSQKYRHDLKKYNSVIKNIAALQNMKFNLALM
ncbi:transposase [bacterium]|nr:transposase [bacterium]